MLFSLLFNVFYYFFFSFQDPLLSLSCNRSQIGTDTISTMTSSTKIQDGGWGWAIIAASFMAQLLAYGSPQSVGVLYPEWLHTYQEGKGMTAWVGSLVAGVGLIASEYSTKT